jgi:natural product precursor
MKNRKKLVLKKEKVAELTNAEMSNLKGGARTCNSTNNGFTCCLCTDIEYRTIGGDPCPTQQ